MIVSIIFIIVLIIGVYCIYDEVNSLINPIKKTYSDTKNIVTERSYMDEFINQTNQISFVEVEVNKKLKSMLQSCTADEIYNNLFKKELKEKISYEQFMNYDTSGFSIDYIGSTKMSDNSIFIYYTTFNKQAYDLIVKDKKITKYEQTK